MGWLSENYEKLGAGVIALSGLVVAAWSKLQSLRTEKAKTSADVAIAQSQGEVYSQMKERLADLALQVERLSIQVDQLREQIRDRDTEIHNLQLYVKDLEHALLVAQIPLPPRR